MAMNPRYFSDLVNLAPMTYTKVIKDAIKTQRCLSVNELDRFPAR